MIENAAAPKNFTTITYVTKDGEKCTATKNNGIVTVQGDKNGVRQVPLDDFMKELAVTLPKVDLARTPNKDTVQFKGGEEKTIPDANEEAKPNHTVRNWSIGLGSVAALIGLGIAGRRGHLGQGLQKLLGGAEKDAGKLADDIAGAAEHTNPHVSTSAEEISVEEFTRAVNKDSDLKFYGAKVEEYAATHSKYPIPESEVLELPKDLELDPAKVMQIGKINDFKTACIVNIPVGNGITRTYTLTPDGSKITNIAETAAGELKPFRAIRFNDGQPIRIEDLTADGTRARILPKAKPAQAPAVKPAETAPKAEAPKAEAPKAEAPKAEAPAAKPKETTPKVETPKADTPAQKPTTEAKKEEIARRKQIDDDIARQQEEAQKEAERLRREQDEMANNDMINAAVLADMMSSAGKKTAEKVGETASNGVDKMVEQLAKEADKAAESVAKADVPKGGNIIEDVLPSAGKAEASVAESTIESGEKAADDLFTPNLAHEADSFHPTEIAEAPKTSYFDDTVDEFGMPKSSLFDDTVDEFGTPKSSLFDDTVDEFGMPKIESYGDDLASYDSGLTNSFDDFSSMDSYGDDLFDI